MDNDQNQETSAPAAATPAPEKSGPNPAVVAGFIGLIIIVALAALFLRGGNAQNSLQPSATQAATAQAEPTVEPTATGSAKPTSTAKATATPKAVVKTFAVEASSYAFNPKEIKVKKGDTVKIVLTAKDMMHDFTIDELKVKVPTTKEGQTKEVTFVADKAGTFEYYCSVANHRQLGQVGKLIVE